MQRLGDRLLSWASILDDATRAQAELAASLPFVRPHLALMPDAHLGRGATVGSVLPTAGAVIPAAVGVDIGCGMIAVRTQHRGAELAGRGLAALRRAIERAVPLSAGRYNRTVPPGSTAHRRVGELRELAASAGFDPGGYAPNWPLQLGTLGGGNHFIEVCVDEQDRVWLFLHSGSRGIGNKIATRHIAVARELCARRRVSLPERDLAYVTEGEPEFDAYLRELRWAQHFALLNREEMMDRTADCLSRFMGAAGERMETINCFAGETQVITRIGTRPIEALAGGRHELLTANGVWIKAPVHSFGRQEVHEVTLSRSGAIKIIRATASHRWLLRSRRGHEYETATAELQRGDRLQFSFTRRSEGLEVDPSAAARGFVYGDGHRVRNRSSANFCGAKDFALLPLFEGLGRPPHRYGSMTRINGLPGEWKAERPPLDTPPNLLYGWLAGYFAADGDVGKTGRPSLSSASRADLEYVRLVCQVIGIGTFGIRSRVRTGYGGRLSPLYLVGLMRADLDPAFFLIDEHRRRFVAGRHAAERRGWNVVSVCPFGVMTEVYCAVVEGTHSFTLADNILTRNCHHNYTERERHDGAEVWLTRKGAINAEPGRPGLIPGSMGTASYVVAGKGNPLALNSAPHGAGRRYSRSAARRTFTHAQLRAAMRGIEYRDTDAFIDEIPDAYKPIAQVMADAADLVEVRHTLRQLVNVKGN